MSYLVLARKYRPQTFSQVVGQDHVTRTLSNAFLQDRVHHAFLFCGPRGCGKTTTARILSKALNCEKGPTPEPCGTCEACISIANGTAVDYFEMDGASNRGIDSIRDLTDAVRYQPAVLRKKVYVIDEVHMLTTEAFNALLKTLEEPPPHVTFVMATTEPHKVPNTILSRCQRYDFKLVPSAGLAAHLTDIFAREKIQIDEASTGLLVRESGGSVRDALSLSDQVISYVGNEAIDEAKVAEVLGVADRSLTRTLISSLAAGDARTCLEAVDTAVARGVDEVQIARAVVRYLRDLAVAQVAPGAESLIEASDEERQDIAQQAQAMAPSQVRQMFDRMLRTCDDLGATDQPRLVLDLGLIEVAATEAVLPLGDLIERLTAMESRLAGGGGAQASGGSGGGRQSNARGTGSASPSSASPSSASPSSASPSSASPSSASPSSASSSSASPSSASPSSASPSNASPSPQASPSLQASPDRESAQTSPAPSSAQAPNREQVNSQEASSPHAGNGEPASDRPDPAEAAPAAASGGGHSTAALRGWESVVVALEQAKEIGLMTVYQTAKVLVWEETRVRVGFPADGLTSEIATAKDKVERMEVFLRKLIGNNLRFEVVLLNPEQEAQAKSILEDAQQRADDDRAQRLLEAKEHPTTKMVLRTFGAAIKEIKVDNV